MITHGEDGANVRHGVAAARVRPSMLLLAALVTVAFAGGACSSAATRGSADVVAPLPSAALPDGDENEAPPPDVAPPSGPTSGGGNHGIRAFDEAKKELGRIYGAAGQHIDLYCGCSFTVEPHRGMHVDLTACGYVPARDAARIEPIERTMRVLPRLASGDRSSWEPPQVFLGTADIDSGFSMDLLTKDLRARVCALRQPDGDRHGAHHQRGPVVLSHHRPSYRAR